MFFLRLTITILYAAGMTALLLLPSSTVGAFTLPIPHFDKLAHAALYAGLALLVAWSLQYRFHHRFWLLWVVLAATAYGIVMEAAQFYLVASERSFEVSDMIANAVGATLAVLFLGCMSTCTGAKRRDVVKRLFDLSVTVVALVLLWPVLLILSVLVRLRLGAPVFFRQLRPGRGGVPFELLKFRTMTEARDETGQLLPDAQRLTGLGRFLRGSSLDELPELLNVLRGEMSLVGPRPLLMQYLGRYSPEQARRHEVLPGITGWAQVNGRNEISWERKFELDVWYVDHRSFWLDLKILWLTVWHVLWRRGINAREHATMPEFRG